MEIPTHLIVQTLFLILITHTDLKCHFCVTNKASALLNCYCQYCHCNNSGLGQTSAELSNKHKVVTYPPTLPTNLATAEVDDLNIFAKIRLNNLPVKSEVRVPLF